MVVILDINAYVIFLFFFPLDPSSLGWWCDGIKVTCSYCKTREGKSQRAGAESGITVSHCTVRVTYATEKIIKWNNEMLSVVVCCGCAMHKLISVV